VQAAQATKQLDAKSAKEVQSFIEHQHQIQQAISLHAPYSKHPMWKHVLLASRFGGQQSAIFYRWIIDLITLPLYDADPGCCGQDHRPLLGEVCQQARR